MKIHKFSLLVLLAVFSETAFSQSNQFNINDYKQFLAANKNLQTSQLLEMYSAGSFVDVINLPLSGVRYLDSINAKYNLTDFEISLLNKNGFFVSERMNKISFGQSLLEIFHRDLPVFVSTDAILHAFHISYDRILKDTELGFLIPKVKLLLQTLHLQQSILQTKYGTNPNMFKMLRDVDVYLTVPLKLFELSIEPYYSENKQTVGDVAALIRSKRPPEVYKGKGVKYEGEYIRRKAGKAGTKK